MRITKTLEVDVHECTNDDFAKFVAATAYETDSEKFGRSFVFHLELDAAARAGATKGERRRVVAAGERLVVARADGAGLRRV